MTRESAEAVGVLVDRLTKPVITVIFSGAICWMGLRTVVNISADQFVGIVTAIILFWFGRPVPPLTESAPPPAAPPKV